MEARLASLEASYRAKRAERERILETNRLRDNKRAIQLNEASLRKLDGKYEQSRTDMEQKRKVSVTFDIEGAGYVSVRAARVRN